MGSVWSKVFGKKDDDNSADSVADSGSQKLQATATDNSAKAGDAKATDNSASAGPIKINPDGTISMPGASITDLGQHYYMVDLQGGNTVSNMVMGSQGNLQGGNVASNMVLGGMGNL
jgi:hypothetical protein